MRATQAVISVATSPAPGAVHLEYEAAHATSFDILHKGPQDTDFTLVAEGAIATKYNATQLVPGDHQYKVIGQNSRRKGSESEVATISVADDSLVQPD